MPKSELIEEVVQSLRSLPSQIKEIKSYDVAVNTGDYGASFYDIYLISEFENNDEFWDYTGYPEHDRVVEYIQSAQLDEQIVDFED